MISTLSTVLFFCSRHSRIILVGSLLVGLLSGSAANIIKPHIDLFIALLLFIACLRVGPGLALGATREIKSSLFFTLILQIVIPLGFLIILWALNIHHPLGIVLVFLTAAPSFSASPHLLTLLGFDSAPALRQLVVGTALVPFTIIPVFIFVPEIGSLQNIMLSSLILLVIILSMATIAFLIRATVLKQPDLHDYMRMDGSSTLLLAIAVIGLMAAIQDELFNDPVNLLLTLAFAFLVCFGLQFSMSLALKFSPVASYTVPMSIIAGNRNFALFLTALPSSLSDSLLVFIGCYQVPMLLTPILMRRFYQTAPV